MTSVLTFQLYGPMASWGEVAVGEERDTKSVPTRSAVLGLCAAALGIERERVQELTDLNEALGFAVCVHRVGTILRDFHTVESPSGRRGRDLGSRRKELEHCSTGTVVSKRHYVTDAYYVVALWAKRDADGDLLGRIERALRTPGFSLFLGRKSCPLALPLAPQITDVETLRDAFTSFPVDAWVAASQRHPEPSWIAWDLDARLSSGFDHFRTSTRWDRFAGRNRRRFGRREEALVRIDFEAEVRR